ncbi:MAG: DUF6882 domain-containing protein [Cyanobacteria bacterium P01_A01_bin.17]
MLKRSIVMLACLLMTPEILGGKLMNAQTTSLSKTGETYEQLVELSREELAFKTELDKSWGLGSYERWDIDQGVGNLIFSNSDGSQAVAPAQIIGTYNTRDNTWMWAWANHSISNSLKTCATKVRTYGTRYGFEKLVSLKWSGSEEDAWTMAAIASHICDAQGAYRGPAGATLIFMTYGNVVLWTDPATED